MNEFNALAMFNFANSYAASEVETNEEFIAIIGGLSGSSAESDVAEWESLRGSFVLGYMAYPDKLKNSAVQAWKRLTANLEKPQTAANAALAEKRKAAKPAAVKPAATVSAVPAVNPSIMSAPVVAVAAMGRELACIELLHGLSEAQLIKIQGVLLKMHETAPV